MKNQQNLSSTTLFNFTDSLERLLENIENGIYCGDVYEKMPPFGKPSGYIVPMVCFCDIPLGMIKEHLEWYGHYGIGIKRDYARKYKVNPVWYIHKDNPIISEMWANNSIGNNPILPYLKCFLGKQQDLSGVERTKKFYDEKEWRYIPEEYKDATMFYKEPHKKTLTRISNQTKKVTRLKIELDRIEYIIVDKEEEKEELYDFLQSLCLNKEIKYEKMVSSIITCTQIRKDF